MNTFSLRRSPALLVAATVAAFSQPASATGQDVTSQVDEIFAWATPASPGYAVAVSQHGKVVVNRAYGSADLERDVPITSDTVFDAGSLTKQFVAAVVLLLVGDGRVALTDDIRTYSRPSRAATRAAKWARYSTSPLVKAGWWSASPMRWHGPSTSGRSIATRSSEA